MGQMTYRPIGVQQYILQFKNWDEVVDGVLDFVAQNKYMTDDQDMQWEIDVRLIGPGFRKIYNLNPLEFNCKDHKSVCAAMTQCIFEICERHSQDAKLIYFETRFMQENFFAQLETFQDIVRKYQKLENENLDASVDELKKMLRENNKDLAENVKNYMANFNRE